MVKTFANFRWDVPVDPDMGPPYVPEVRIAEFVGVLRSAGLNVTDTEDQEYAFGFSCRLEHLRMDCQIGRLLGEETWLLACYPRRGWLDWAMGRYWYDEQQQFVNRVNAILGNDSRVTELQWRTMKEIDRPSSS